MKKRLVYNKILSQQNYRKASIIIGPRQVGKTTILRELQRQLGGLFFDVDIFSDYEQISTYERAIATFKINGYQEMQKEFFYVFIDEFQRYADLSRVIKSIYDHHENIKIYATGSSSLAIKNSIQESLAGRKMTTHVFPLSFEEFLHFRDRDDLTVKIAQLGGVETDDYFVAINEVRVLLDEFLVFGGYPDVVLAKTTLEKQDALRSIFDLYIKKDFAEYVKMEKLRSASQLMKILAINNGQAANYAKYGSAAGIGTETVQNYLSILQETFIISILRPYFTNKNKEISKMPKIYFLDNGVRNYFLGNFSTLDLRQDAGFLFEGFYISELIKRGIDSETIKYYRTKSGEEIDIVLDAPSMLLPIELKFKKTTGARDISALKRFVEKNKLPKGYLVAMGQLKKIEEVEIIDCFRNII
ncbi:MAG: hypothetical protein UT50_C0009G0025 [Candidatus Moranbacteria bacterium GW2011_GWA2_39_41]|nr:MAG: hypothetical protein UT50_C0009G0025 [Candidatus Moranbacteria bacterium GW2011_GWA2_39_41]